MEIRKRYVVYELNKVMGSKNHKALQNVEFSNKHNSFETEDEAIQALVDDKKTYENYLIIKEITLIDY